MVPIYKNKFLLLSLGVIGLALSAGIILLFDDLIYRIAGYLLAIAGAAALYQGYQQRPPVPPLPGERRQVWDRTTEIILAASLLCGAAVMVRIMGFSEESAGIGAAVGGAFGLVVVFIRDLVKSR